MLNETTVKNVENFAEKFGRWLLHQAKWIKQEEFLHESIVKMFFLWYTAYIIYTLQLYATYNKCFIIQNNV